MPTFTDEQSHTKTHSGTGAVGDPGLRRYTVHAEIIVAGSGGGIEQATSGTNGREQLEKSLVSHVVETAYAQTGMIRAAAPERLNRRTPFENLRQLEPNWDGQGSAPPSENLIRKGEDVWAQLAEMKLQQMPVVRAGSDGFISFSWLQTYPDPHMEITLYERDNASFECDWFIRKDSKVSEGGSVHPYSDLRKLLQAYFGK